MQESAKEMYWLNSCASVRLRWRSKKSFSAGERGNLSLGQFFLDRFAERMIVRRRQIRLVAGRVDRGHHREKAGAGIELPGFGRERGRREGRQQEKRKRDTGQFIYALEYSSLPYRTCSRSFRFTPGAPLGLPAGLPAGLTAGRAIATSMFLQTVAVHAWPRKCQLGGAGAGAPHLGREHRLPLKSPAEPAQFGVREILRRRLVPRPHRLQSAGGNDRCGPVVADRRFAGQFLRQPAAHCPSRRCAIPARASPSPAGNRHPAEPGRRSKARLRAVFPPAPSNRPPAASPRSGHVPCKFVHFRKLN